jgi:hypothetical protein
MTQAAPAAVKIPTKSPQPARRRAGRAKASHRGGEHDLPLPVRVAQGLAAADEFLLPTAVSCWPRL